MIAYNTTSLKNIFIQEQADAVYSDGAMHKEEREDIKIKYPVDFYTPSFFIAAGLFLLTCIILLFSFGLIALLFLNSIENAIGGMLVFFALLSYGALELMISSKKHYRSGVDDALIWASAICLFIGINIIGNISSIGNCLLIFGIATFLAVRFTDRLMSVTAFLAILGFVFFACAEIGNITKAIAPFILMIVSAVVYFMAKKKSDKQEYDHYHNCYIIVTIAALICFYCAGNYYVVRELSISMFDLRLLDTDTIPFGWLFWIFTILIPAFYLFMGIKNKDSILIRTALFLIAATIFTVRYYHTIAPLETVMTLAGIFIIAVSYGLISYLKIPKHGFTYVEDKIDAATEKIQIESLIIAETFAQDSSLQEPSKFGGGSFGGGGASGEF